MRTIAFAAKLVAGAVLIAAAGTNVAQGPPGGMPPGQAKKQGYDNGQQGRDNDRGTDRGRDNDQGRGMPPGQAKKNPDFRFRDDDRGRFYSHYQSDANRWRGRKRPNFAAGQVIPPSYSVRVVPRSYWQGAPPPPPGYQYGYYDGYVVAYNPTTRIIADVLDLVTAAVGR